MGGAFLFGCRKPPWCLQKHWDVPLSLRPGLTIAAGALLLSRLCPQQRGQLQQQGAEAGTRAHNLRRCHTRNLCRRLSRNCHLQGVAFVTLPSFFPGTFVLHLLCHSLRAESCSSHGSCLKAPKCHHASVATAGAAKPPRHHHGPHLLTCAPCGLGQGHGAGAPPAPPSVP